ncbi:hypothetical protein MKEN_00046300 [Mycena kentingensis (nom. inval.)]|nr:hypothetical protein MKEN_00046300 [Mycena kentingensis (nom. inval.)]
MAATAMKKEKNATAKKHSESEDRSSSLSPEPAPGSRQSTPLSELSPPPDDDDEDDTKQEGKDADGEDKSKGPPQRDAPLLDQSQPKASASPVATPAPGGQLPDPTVKPKFVLELNEELLKALIELQNRKTPYTDLLYRAYGARVESNLAWAARVADPNTAKFNFSLPMMEAPPPIDLYSTERIQEMYAQLPTMFATDIARSQSGSNALKRERPEELPMDGMNKRRDTGESKVMTPDGASAELAGPMGGLGAGSGMLPRPNGTATPPPTQSSPQNPGMGMQPQQQHTMMNQAIQMRQQQQQQQQQQLLMQRQMSPPSAGVGGNGMPNSGNAAAGPSGLGGVNVASLPPVMQQMYAILTQQGARHQLVQHLLKLNPNFLSMPVNAQLQQMAQFYVRILFRGYFDHQLIRL